MHMKMLDGCRKLRLLLKWGMQNHTWHESQYSAQEFERSLCQTYLLILKSLLKIQEANGASMERETSEVVIWGVYSTRRTLASTILESFL